jgi:hypothetical protein
MAAYHEPDLLRNMIYHRLREIERCAFPVVKARRPEEVGLWEDFAYNHGMLINPKAFRELCQCMTRLHEICGSDLGSFPRKDLR